TRWPRDWSSDVCSSDLRGAAESLELGNVARAVELKLHEGVPGMLPDVVRRVRVAADQVIAVGVRRALRGELGRGLGVAQREPERSEERRVGKEGNIWMV